MVTALHADDIAENISKRIVGEHQAVQVTDTGYKAVHDPVKVGEHSIKSVFGFINDQNLGTAVYEAATPSQQTADAQSTASDLPDHLGPNDTEGRLKWGKHLLALSKDTSQVDVTFIGGPEKTERMSLIGLSDEQWNAIETRHEQLAKYRTQAMSPNPFVKTTGPTPGS